MNSITFRRRISLRVPAALAGALVLLLSLSGAAGARSRAFTAANWNISEQQVVLNTGAMTELPIGGFAGAGHLTAQQDSQALALIAARDQLEPVVASGSMTVVHFDALLIEQLGLGDVAEHVQQAAMSADLAPPSYFGTEVLARYLGLRYNHLAGEDRLELYPRSVITRAEAAHSFAVALDFQGWETSSAREVLMGFSLPSLSSAQRRVLHIAVSEIGMPYVWGGTTDNTADGLEHGGFDCSGFAWRVYKLSKLRWGRRIHGRTAAQQAGEMPESQRIAMESVQPGDLLFFGSAHLNSPATESTIIHEGIALSDEWVIHSSGQGVYVLPLRSGWLAEQFSWARRVI